jgi:hypothetical protein
VGVRRARKTAAALPAVLERHVERRLRSYCRTRVPARERRYVELYSAIRGVTVTLVEKRPTFYDPEEWTDTHVAQFRYDPRARRWTLYCADGHGRWHRYPGVEPTEEFDELLREVDTDPMGLFWA